MYVPERDISAPRPKPEEPREPLVKEFVIQPIASDMQAPIEEAHPTIGHTFQPLTSTPDPGTQKDSPQPKMPGDFALPQKYTPPPLKRKKEPLPIGVLIFCTIYGLVTAYSFHGLGFHDLWLNILTGVNLVIIVGLLLGVNIARLVTIILASFVCFIVVCMLVLGIASYLKSQNSVGESTDAYAAMINDGSRFANDEQVKGIDTTISKYIGLYEYHPVHNILIRNSLRLAVFVIPVIYFTLPRVRYVYESRRR